MIPDCVIVSKANSTPAFTIAIIKTPLSKYSCSEMCAAVGAVFSKLVSAVAALQVNRLMSSFAQSIIIFFENSPEIISSICF